MKIAIFHDYFGAIGGGERVVLLMARILDADIITTDTDALPKMDPDVRVISLGPTSKYRGYKQIAAFLKFYRCDFSRDYDLFIFQRELGALCSTPPPPEYLVLPYAGQGVL